MASISYLKPHPSPLSRPKIFSIEFVTGDSGFHLNETKNNRDNDTDKRYSFEEKALIFAALS